MILTQFSLNNFHELTQRLNMPIQSFFHILQKMFHCATLCIILTNISWTFKSMHDHIFSSWQSEANFLTLDLRFHHEIISEKGCYFRWTILKWNDSSHGSEHLWWKRFSFLTLISTRFFGMTIQWMIFPKTDDSCYKSEQKGLRILKRKLKGQNFLTKLSMITKAYRHLSYTS